MDPGLIGRAAGMFAVTNVDDILILALFFGRAAGRAAALRVVIGQYLGFGAILAVSVAGALGATLLPERFHPYLGLVPLALGLRAAWRTWRERRDRDRAAGPADDHGDDPGHGQDVRPGPGVLAVAGVTLANGGDNVGVYVPVLTTAGSADLVVYALVFLALVAVWCAAGWFLATRPAVARALSRWGHLLLPAVLIGIGLVILLEGAGFGG